MSDIPIHDMTKREHEHRWTNDFMTVQVRKGRNEIRPAMVCVDPDCGETREVKPRPKPTRILSEEEFEKEFDVDNNGGSFYSWLAISHLDEHYVWTITEVPGDPKDNMYAIPGVHKVNRIDYVVSTTPWTDDIAEAVYYDREKNLGKAEE